MQTIIGGVTGLLEIDVLGAFAVRRAGAEVTGFASNKVRGLLAYLAIESHSWHSRAHLAALFWPEQSPDQGLVYVRNALSNMRKVLGDAGDLLQDRAHHLRFDVEAANGVDLEALHSAVLSCETHAHRRASTCPTCLTRAESSLSRYQGQVLGGIADDFGDELQAWVAMLDERAHQDRIALLSLLSRGRAALGELREARRHAEQLVAIDPWREESHLALMDILARMGERSAAARQFQLCRQILVRELQIEPGPVTVARYQSILRLPDASRPRPMPIPGLPVPLLPLYGRRALLQRIEAQLNDPRRRLITLVGPAGAGKTRLALTATQDSAVQFRGRVWWVATEHLEGKIRLTGVPEMLARALGLPESAGPEAMARAIGHEDALVVLDGCVQRCTAAARLATSLLARCHGLCVLVTGREALGLPGEVCLPVGPMEDAPDADSSEAIGFLRERAAYVRPGMHITGARADRAAEICRLLDNLPLGILQVAARMDAYSLEEILAQVERDPRWLDRRMRADNPDSPSLSGRLARSYAALTQPAQDVLRQLALVEDTWDPRAYPILFDASSIPDAEVRQHVASLVSLSLATAGRSQGGRRYRMYRTVRAFALDRLEGSGERAAAEARHRAWRAITGAGGRTGGLAGA